LFTYSWKTWTLIWVFFPLSVYCLFWLPVLPWTLIWVVFFRLQFDAMKPIVTVCFLPICCLFYVKQQTSKKFNIVLKHVCHAVRENHETLFLWKPKLACEAYFAFSWKPDFCTHTVSLYRPCATISATAHTGTVHIDVNVQWCVNNRVVAQGG
jgi:hypothetical protein